MIGDANHTRSSAGLSFKSLDTLVVRYEYFESRYENARLRALYLLGPAGSTLGVAAVVSEPGFMLHPAT